MAERVPVVMRERGKTLVEAPVSTSIGMNDSSSVSHSRRAGARSAARGGFLAWNGAGAAVDVGVVARAGAGLEQLEMGASCCEGESPSPW